MLSLRKTSISLAEPTGSITLDFSGNSYDKCETMSAIELAVALVLSIVTTIYSPGEKIYYPAAEETKEEATMRVGDISGDVVEIAFNPDTEPLFDGPYGRTRTAILMLAIMTNESGFRKDVDFALGPDGRGDGGRSWCLMQLNIGKGTTIKWNWVENRVPYWGDDPLNLFNGYYGYELVADRRLCLSEGLKAMTASMRACKKLPLNQRLAGYVIGNCNNPEGYPGSEDRFATAMKWYVRTKALRTYSETDVLAQWADWQKVRHPNVVSSRQLDQVTLSKRNLSPVPVLAAGVKQRVSNKAIEKAVESAVGTTTAAAAPTAKKTIPIVYLN